MAPKCLFTYSDNYSLSIVRELQVPKSGIFKLLLITILLLGAAFLVRYFAQIEKTKHLVQESQDASDLARAASELVALWRSGDPAMLAPYCRDMFDPTVIYPDHYFRCNPDYMKCLLSQRPKVGDVEASWMRVIPARGMREWGLALKLTKGRSTEILNLGDSCSSVELPERRYAFKTSRSDILWDSFNRSIWIDRAPVSWRDIQEWMTSLNENLKFAKPATVPVNSRHLPATGLTLKEMKDYCAYRGKTLASLPVFEAASYHPRDPKVARPRRVVRTPYPWSIYSKSEFLYRARSNKWRVNREDCRKAFVAECAEYGGMEKFGDMVPTWTGIVDTIGGVPEVFLNPYEPGQNLFVSNASLNAASTWNELGKYASWNGAGFSVADFDLGENNKDVSFPLMPGFRCMVER